MRGRLLGNPWSQWRVENCNEPSWRRPRLVHIVETPLILSWDDVRVPPSLCESTPIVVVAEPELNAS